MVDACVWFSFLRQAGWVLHPMSSDPRSGAERVTPPTAAAKGQQQEALPSTMRVFVRGTLALRGPHAMASRVLFPIQHR